MLGKDTTQLRLIICHVGNGGSLTAVKNGHSIDTTMGFTPLDGLMMGTRSGAVDPGILIHLMSQGYSAEQFDRMLNKESGLKGISGVSHDLREIGEAIRAPHRKSNAQGNSRAALAQDLYLHRLKACIGSMLMSLGGLDAMIFTACIGFEVVNNTITTTFPFLDITVFYSDLEDGLINVWNLVSWQFTRFEHLDKGLNIQADFAVALGQSAHIFFKPRRKANLHGGAIRHLSDSIALRWVAHRH